MKSERATNWCAWPWMASGCSSCENMLQGSRAHSSHCSELVFSSMLRGAVEQWPICKSWVFCELDLGEDDYHDMIIEGFPGAIAARLCCDHEKHRKSTIGEPTVETGPSVGAVWVEPCHGKTCEPTSRACGCLCLFDYCYILIKMSWWCFFSTYPSFAIIIKSEVYY